MIGTRDRIVTAAGERFRRHGYNGTSVKDITGAAGVTIGSLYHFFPGGKEQLTAEVLRTTGAAYLALFEAIADEAGDVGLAVSRFFDGAADVLAETGFVDICPIGGVAREVASSSEVLRAASAEVFTSWEDAFARRLREGGVGRLVAARLATTVVAALEGGFTLSRARRDAVALRDVGAVVRATVDAAVGDAAGSPKRRARVGPAGGRRAHGAVSG